MTYRTIKTDLVVTEDDVEVVVQAINDAYAPLASRRRALDKLEETTTVYSSLIFNTQAEALEDSFGT